MRKLHTRNLIDCPHVHPPSMCAHPVKTYIVVVVDHHILDHQQHRVEEGEGESEKAKRRELSGQCVRGSGEGVDV